MFYVDLFRALDRDEVRYLLTGGLAINIYGVERATMDIDLMLALDAGNLQRFLKTAESLGLQPVLPVKLSDLADEAKRQDWVENRNMPAFCTATAGGIGAYGRHPGSAKNRFRRSICSPGR